MNKEERLRLLIENAPDMIYRMSLPEGQYEYVSPAVKKIFGYTPQELYDSPKLIQQIIHHDWADYFAKEWEALLKGDMPDSYDYQIVDKQGEIKWIHQRNVLVLGESGTPVAIEGIVRDVTERKMAEDKLKESEDLLIQTEEMARVGGWQLDLKSNRVKWTRITCLIHDVPEDFVPSLEDAINFFHPDYREKVADTVKIALESGEPYEFEAKIISAKGKELWVRSIGKPTMEQGKCIKLSGTFQDITEQKKIRDALKKSEEKVRQLLKHTYEAIYGLDINGNCTFANPSCVKMLGYKSEEELLGKNMHKLAHSKHADGREYPEDECHIYEAFIKNTTTRIDNEVFWKADGTSFPVEYFSHPIYSEHGEVTGCVVTFLDISTRKNDELVRLALIEKLEKALSEVKTLRGIIPICSHCKQIRDDEGAWSQVEKYVSQHTDAEFSHGICPECLQKHYPEDYEAIMNKEKSNS